LRIKGADEEQSYLSGIENKIQELLFFFTSEISRNVHGRFPFLQNSLTAVTVCDSSDGVRSEENTDLNSDVKTLLKMIYLEREPTNSDSTDTVRTALNVQDIYEVDAMSISLLQYLSRRVGVWRAMQLGSLDTQHSSLRSTSPSSPSPSSSSLPSLLPSLPRSQTQYSEVSANHSMKSDGGSVVCLRGCQGLCVCSAKDRELNSSPFLLFGLTDLQREANLTVFLLNSCVSLFKSPPSALTAGGSAEHNQYANSGGGGGEGEEFDCAELAWSNLQGVLGSSLQLESSALKAQNVSACEIVKKWPINANLKVEDDQNVMGNESHIDKLKGTRSSGLNDGSTLTLLDKDLLRLFRRHWSEVLSGKYNGGDRDCSEGGRVDSSHANTTASNSNTSRDNSSSNSNSYSDSSDTNSSIRSYGNSNNNGNSNSNSGPTLCSSIHTVKLSLLTVSSIITASYTEYDPVTDGWRSGVSGVGLSLESRLESKMDTVKVLIRELSYPWFLQVQGSVELELPSVKIFQGDCCEDLYVCLCVCVFLCVFVCVTFFACAYVMYV
jgi:hypothetical protein